MADTSQRSVGAYAIEGELARGGMGVLLRARHMTLDRPAVLKKLPRDFAAQPELLARFEREGRAAAAVRHRNVVLVHDAFCHRGEHYLACELVDGTDLRHALGDGRRVPPRVAVHLALEIARGLEAIHAQGVVHRDLKPSNILLGRRGEVKITDFGVALDDHGVQLTQPGVTYGTPPYMPPEQLLGDRVDARGDLYAFGVLLYEMLTGRTPFRTPDESETSALLGRMQAERYRGVRRLAPDCPRWLATLVHACLRARPARRPAAAGVLRSALEKKVGRGRDSGDEVARWLWDEGVFEPRDDETRRAEPVATPRFELRPILRAAGVGVVLGLSVWLFFGTAPEDRALLESALRELPARVAAVRP